MNFRLASTFNDSLLKLAGDEQKAPKTTVFDLQFDPSNPGMSFHKLDKAEDKSFWSVHLCLDREAISSCAIWYEIYRFGGAELREENEALKIVASFFYDLFKKHQIGQ